MRSSAFAAVAVVLCIQVAVAAAPVLPKSAAVTRKRSIGAAATKPLSPSEALAAFRVPADLEVERVLAEPTVRQPLFVDWDERADVGGRIYSISVSGRPQDG